jgi:hypothetical protein
MAGMTDISGPHNRGRSGIIKLWRIAMNMKSTLAASAFALAIGLAMPAAAQQTSDTNAGPTTGGVGVGNTATSTSTSTDLNVQDSGNDNSDNSIDVADSGNDNSDNSIADSGNLTVSDSGNDNSDNSVNDSGNLAFALASFNTDNSNNSTNDSNNNNDSSSVVALQVLTATVSNAAPLNFQSLLSDYSSGDNSVNGSAFAAFSGILNNGWNTGINANAQAATNVAARGTVTFSQ